MALVGYLLDALLPLFKYDIGKMLVLVPMILKPFQAWLDEGDWTTYLKHRVEKEIVRAYLAIMGHFVLKDFFILFSLLSPPLSPSPSTKLLAH